jgi:hypothetical protein
MIISPVEEVEFRDLELSDPNGEGEVLISEARVMALMALDSFFPNIRHEGDIVCYNCERYLSRICDGKDLGFEGVIECMVKMAISGLEHH